MAKEIGVSASWLAGFEDDPVKPEPEDFAFSAIKDIIANRENIALLNVKDDSMAPTLKIGDSVIIDKDSKLSGGSGLFAVVINGVETIRECSLLTSGLIALSWYNERIEDIKQIAPESIDVIGRVIWFSREL